MRRGLAGKCTETGLDRDKHALLELELRSDDFVAAGVGPHLVEIALQCRV